mmetsp:Transcript_12078/g.24628  ORF Transcript_12078/g.24628 Transcript_12078/m.24628 type:complete len:439 (+) Transcript_12078:1660-2976(+)
MGFRPPLDAARTSRPRRRDVRLVRRRGTRISSLQRRRPPLPPAGRERLRTARRSGRISHAARAAGVRPPVGVRVPSPGSLLRPSAESLRDGRRRRGTRPRTRTRTRPRPRRSPDGTLPPLLPHCRRPARPLFSLLGGGRDLRRRRRRVGEHGDGGSPGQSLADSVQCGGARPAEEVSPHFGGGAGRGGVRGVREQCREWECRGERDGVSDFSRDGFRRERQRRCDNPRRQPFVGSSSLGRRSFQRLDGDRAVFLRTRRRNFSRSLRHRQTQRQIQIPRPHQRQLQPRSRRQRPLPTHPPQTHPPLRTHLPHPLLRRRRPPTPRRLRSRPSRLPSQETRMAPLHEPGPRRHTHRTTRSQRPAPLHHHERMGQAKVLGGGPDGGTLVGSRAQRVQFGESARGASHGEDVYHGGGCVGQERGGGSGGEEGGGAFGEDGSFV